MYHTIPLFKVYFVPIVFEQEDKNVFYKTDGGGVFTHGLTLMKRLIFLFVDKSNKHVGGGAKVEVGSWIGLFVVIFIAIGGFKKMKK